ncbi:hypothetical protein BC832DRAFT_566864 [Gaertneriomyces semiglobifer]|nr:hypothetical protein BC832DRAFT_566864 [Gaertneriomyces semiglobifer]
MLFDPNMIIPPPTQTATPSTSTGEIQVALKTSLGIFYARTTVPLHIVLFTPAGRVDPDTFLQSWGDASLNSHITTTTSGSNISSTGGDLEPALEKRNVFVVARRNVDTGVVVFVSVGVDGVGGGAGGGVGRVLAEVRFDPTQNVMVTVKAKMGVEMLKGIAEALAGIVRTL